MKIRRHPIVSLIAGMSAFGFATPFSVRASDYYWGTATNQASWAVATNWFEEAGGLTAATAAPGASDHAVFSITSLNGTAVVPRILSNIAVGGMTFKNTVAFNLHGGTGRLLTVGSNGVSKDSGTAQATIGSGTGSEGILVRFSANQTWTNNSDTVLQIRNSAASADGAGSVVVTLQAAGASNITNSGAFTDGTGSTLGIIVDSAGTGVVAFASSTYSGGTTIKRGVLQANGAGIGTAAVRLGDTTGSANATLRINTTTATTTGLITQAGNTGVSTLEFISTSGTYDGAITLDNDLHVGVRQSGATGATINGTISGTGDLIKGQYQGGNSQVLILAGANTYTGDTVINNGAFTLAATTGSLTFSIGANGVNNQVTATAVNNSAVTFNGTFNFNLTLAALGEGHSWLIVNKSMLTNTSFASTFAVNGFSESNNIWTNGAGFTFSEATGILSYSAIPEPSVYAVIGGLGTLGFAAFRRRRS